MTSELENVALTDNEFVTVGDAVALLGVSERTIRRVIKAATTAADGGTMAALCRRVERRTRSGKRSSTTYSVRVLRSLLETDEQSTEAETPVPGAKSTEATTAADTGTTQASTEADGGSTVATVAGAGVLLVPAEVADLKTRAEVAEARAALLENERDNLRESLARSQENETKALTRLAESEDRAKLLLAAVATGKLPAYASPGATEEQGTGQDSTATPPEGNEPAPGVPADVKPDDPPWWTFPALRFWEKRTPK